MRLCTYNVQGRLWQGDRRSSERVEAVLAEVAADVFALQEAHPPPGSPTTWVSPGGETYQAVYGPTLTKRRGPFGNVLLSRYPVSAVKRIDLSLPAREPRGALDVLLDRDGDGLRVVGTHLGLRARERIAQVARLLQVGGAPEQDLLVFLGDVNEWRRGAALRMLEGHFGPAPSVRSFPSRWPLLALDRVWTRPASALLALESHRTALSSRASDHLPVVATVATDGIVGGEPSTKSGTGQPCDGSPAAARRLRSSKAR